MRPFRLWPFNSKEISFWRFVLIGTFIAAGIGAIGVGFWRIQMRNVELKNIEQRTIEQRQLEPARDLTSIWSGYYEWGKYHAGEGAYCHYEGTLTLDLKQNGNTFAGTWLRNITKTTGLPGLDCSINGPSAPINIANGSINASSFQFMLGTTQVSGSITTDLMSGQYEQQEAGGGQTTFKGSFKLTRQEE